MTTTTRFFRLLILSKALGTRKVVGGRFSTLQQARAYANRGPGSYLIERCTERDGRVRIEETFRHGTPRRQPLPLEQREAIAARAEAGTARLPADFEHRAYDDAPLDGWDD